MQEQFTFYCIPVVLQEIVLQTGNYFLPLPVTALHFQSCWPSAEAASTLTPKRPENLFYGRKKRFVSENSGF